MWIIPVVIIAVAFCVVATCCLLAIFNVRSNKGKPIMTTFIPTWFIGTHWRSITNLKESNVKEQKYVQRIYGIEGLIASIFVFGGFMCMPFRQMIPACSLLGIGIIFLVVFELVLLKCKKFQECKYEISDEKRLQEYFDELKNNVQNANKVDADKINTEIVDIDKVDTVKVCADNSEEGAL